MRSLFSAVFTKLFCLHTVFVFVCANHGKKDQQCIKNPAFLVGFLCFTTVPVRTHTQTWWKWGTLWDMSTASTVWDQEMMKLHMISQKHVQKDFCDIHYFFTVLSRSRCGLIVVTSPPCVLLHQPFYIWSLCHAACSNLSFRKELSSVWCWSNLELF